ncbi:MAG: fibronectin type III domain-containing protein, partial [Elusimicrobia bacterium]|nr:fibronectin type III domain-containing protein [Candidatus Obscuribacterium magneticum]
LRVHIRMQPNAVTDLVAAPVGAQVGDIRLSWTAPSNNNRIPISSYSIRFATYPAIQVGNAETWWNQRPGSEVQVGPAFSPGTLEFTTLHNFTLNVTYYFAIKSIDMDGLMSSTDTRAGTVNQAACQPLGSGLPQVPANLTGVALSTTQIQWSWDSATYATYYQLIDSPSLALIAQTTNQTVVEPGLSPNMSVTRAVRGGNHNGLSAPSSPLTVYTFAAQPTNLTITTVGVTSVSLNWNQNGNSPNTNYRLERSLDGITFNFVALLNSTTHQDTGLTQLTTYYYRVRAQNGIGILTNPSLVVSTVTLGQIDFNTPDEPLGLKGYLDPTEKAFTLIWEPVSQNS